MRLGRMLWRGGTALLTSTLVATLLVVAGAADRGSVGRARDHRGVRVDVPLHRLRGLPQRRLLRCGLRRGQQPDVLADVQRPQLHQLRRLPDDPGRHVDRAPVGRHRHGLQLGPRDGPTSPTSGRASGRWRGGTATHGGIGSSGHVAYVERVVSADEIVISEDSWSGDFHWRTITRDSGRWPTRLRPLRRQGRPEHRGPASSRGTPQVGVELTASRGTWSPGREPDHHPAVVRRRRADRRRDRPDLHADRGREAGCRSRSRSPPTRDGYAAATVTTAPTEPVARGEFTMSRRPRSAATRSSTRC